MAAAHLHIPAHYAGRGIPALQAKGPDQTFEIQMGHVRVCLP